MSEIRRIGDRITVLRDGRRVATLDVAEVDDERLLELMTGRVISQIFPDDRSTGRDDRCSRSRASSPRTASVSGVSLAVRAGEVVGLAGLVGSGKSEVGARLLRPRAASPSGASCLTARDVTGRSPRAMLDRGALLSAARPARARGW